MSQSDLSEYGILAIEDVTGPAPPTVGREVIVLTVESNLGFVADPLHYHPPTVRRECWWDELVRSIERQPVVFIDRILDFLSIVSSISKPSTNGSRKGRTMERREDRPVSVRWSKRLVEAIERVVRLFTKFLDRVQPSLVDGLMRLLVEVGEKRFTIISTPELLPITPRSLVREFLFGSPLAGRILGNEFLVDTPAEERRNIVPVGVRRRAGDLILVDSFL